MIDFKLLNKAGLDNFINSPEFERLTTIPITRHRAISHINNPRADEDDILLMLAYIGPEMVGYAGLLPDLIYISGDQYKCGILSCFWVNPTQRRMGIASTLLKKSHELYERIIVSDYVPYTIGVYDRSGLFSKPKKSTGVRVYMRMDLHNILPPKTSFFQLIRPVLYVGDVFLNLFLDIRFLFYRNRLKDRNIEYISEIDDETSVFIYDLQQKDLFKRNRKELNWIIKYPWILPKYKGDRDTSRYAFASTDKSFDYVCIKLRDEQDKLTAFILLTKRNRVLRTAYCYVLPHAVQMLADVIVDHIYKWRINTFISYHPELYPYFLRHNIGQVYKKTTQKPYLFSKELDQLLKNVSYELRDGDADSVFS